MPALMTSATSLPLSSEMSFWMLAESASAPTGVEMTMERVSYEVRARASTNSRCFDGERRRTGRRLGFARRRQSARPSAHRRRGWP